MSEIRSQYQQLKDERDALLLKVAELERRLEPVTVYEVRLDTCLKLNGTVGRYTDYEKAYGEYKEAQKKSPRGQFVLMAVRHEEWPLEWTKDCGEQQKEGV